MIEKICLAIIELFLGFFCILCGANLTLGIICAIGIWLAGAANIAYIVIDKVQFWKRLKELDRIYGNG